MKQLQNKRLEYSGSSSSGSISSSSSIHLLRVHLAKSVLPSCLESATMMVVVTVAVVVCGNKLKTKRLEFRSLGRPNSNNADI